MSWVWEEEKNSTQDPENRRLKRNPISSEAAEGLFIMSTNHLAPVMVKLGTMFFTT